VPHAQTQYPTISTMKVATALLATIASASAFAPATFGVRCTCVIVCFEIGVGVASKNVGLQIINPLAWRAWAAARFFRIRKTM
jgi:hypothetical protein